MKRKSPIHHKVCTHLREGHRVQSYFRGHGKVSHSIKKRIVRRESFSKSHEPREYTVTAEYVDKTSETVKVIGHSPEEAIHFGLMKMHRRSERPVKVTAKNILGDIVGKIGAWTVGGVKKAGQVYSETRARAKEGEEQRKVESEYKRQQAEVAKEQRMEELRQLAKQGDVAAQRALVKLEAEKEHSH